MAGLAPHPISIGHLQISSKRTYNSLSSIPEGTLARLFSLATKLSWVLFESFDIGGTNLLLKDGVEQEYTQIILDVIPRTTEDKINFLWTPLKQTEEEFKQSLALLEQAMTMEEEEKEKKQPDKMRRSPEDRNYMVDQLMRRP
ncbi:hypothetical protein J4460_02190 [Candidatus Woesearchaeota archaeon]|nr:hypothetical protein [Candidatus Woesearchaeota archaeon]HIH38918.1 hypothetical protein [Candidatus Woesearchaeota archaeon]HIH49688.1 hypothetical protein [Candidatus Woesearchaeota archaeon]HIJ03749.1 hypothetical protein [Candidatus Woesearchaeota archaeon]